MPDEDLVTQYLFIDTCSLRHRQFDFKGRVFTALLELAKTGYARLLTTSLTVAECKVRIREAVNIAKTQQKKFAGEAWALKRVAGYDALFEPLDADSVIGEIIAELEHYFSAAGAEFVDLDRASVSQVVQNYLEGAPPFGGGEKRAEFPDALVLSALEAWCDEYGREVYVVSRDEKLKEACDKSSALYPLADVSDFLNLISKHEGLASERILKAFRLYAHAIETEVRAKFGDIDMYLTGYYSGDANLDSIDDVSIGEPDVIDIGETESTLEAECEISFRVEISYEDTDTGMWDSEDKVMLFMDQVEKSIRQTVYVTAEFLAQYESLASISDPAKIEVSLVSLHHDGPIKIEYDPWTERQ
jgi:hypothetical protein